MTIDLDKIRADAERGYSADPPTVLALLDRVAELESQHRDLTGRIGFGDNITEPMADNDTIVEFVETVTMEADEHRECPTVCELCGERLADTDCSHCHGSGGNLAAIAKSGAYAECEWCAGAGKVHEGCVEKSYAELATRVAELEAVVGRVEALCAGAWWTGEVHREDIRAALAGDRDE